MKTLALAFSAAALALAVPAALPARAQSSSSTTVIQRDQSPPSSGVVIEERKAPTVVEERSTETTGTVSECQSKSVKTENAVGDSTTVTKKSCD